MLAVAFAFIITRSGHQLPPGAWTLAFFMLMFDLAGYVIDYLVK